MTLAQALDLIRQREETARKRKVALICGFEPLHLGTFLKGHIAERFESEGAELRTGLYGDLEGTLAAAVGAECEAAALVLEWSQIDSRLGLRSSGGWGLSVQQDILESCRARFARLRRGLEALASIMPVVVVGQTLAIPLLGHTPGGRVSRQELELQRELTAFLADAASFERVSILNPARLDKLSPADGRSDPRMELNAGFPYTIGHASVLAGQMVEALFPRTPMKGIITDLDNTLWSGIVGETGAGGVSWSLAEHTQIHGLYQQLLRHFSEMGVLLAIASKNELSVVKETLGRGDLYIPGSAFYPVRADWGAKSRHIEEILSTWNVGADSVAFIDDSPMELDEVRTAFPSMRCMQFPGKQPAAAITLFEQLRDWFGKSVINREDTLRQASIQAGEVFRESARSAENGDFIRSLQGRVIFDNRKNPANQRLLELINKTNQFNLNGVRISEGEWLRHLADPAGVVVGVSYEDKFGPLGVIGVVAGKRAGDRMEISAWVMSCRAFSRRIEFHTLQYLFEETGAQSVSLAFRATERNQPTQEFLRSIGLENEGAEGWVLSKERFTSGGYELPHRVSLTGETVRSDEADLQPVA
jgi:FkbH-like protein